MKNVSNDNKINSSEEESYSIFKNDKNIFPSLKKELIFDMNKDKYFLYENNINNKNNKNKLFQ